MTGEGVLDAQRALESARQMTEIVAATIRHMNDFDAALVLADTLREQIGEPATNVRFQIIVDQYDREGQNYTRLGERLGLSRQRAKQLIDQAAKRGIKPRPKSRKK